jgi:hypothetical protein
MLTQNLSDLLCCTIIFVMIVVLVIYEFQKENYVRSICALCLGIFGLIYIGLCNYLSRDNVLPKSFTITETT